METKRAGLSRLRLIKSARGELSKHGYAGSSLAVIAGAAGLRKPSIFAHFATKDDLYAAVIEDCLGELAETMSAAAARAASPEDVACALRTLYAEDRSGARVLVRELFDGRAPGVRVRERLEEMLAALCTRWPSMDHHLALSFVGMHLLWWAALEQGGHGAPPEHSLRMLGDARYTSGARLLA